VVPSGQGSQVLDASTGTTMSALTLPSAWGEVRDVAWSDEGHVVMASQQLDVAGEPTHELAMCTVSSGECRVVLQSSSEIVLPR
jgi:hypothetical protein